MRDMWLLRSSGRLHGVASLMVALGFIGGAAILASCELPLQAARAVQVEGYHQRYSFKNIDEATAAIEIILGKENRCAIKQSGKEKSELWGKALLALSSGKFMTHGQVVLTTSLYPWGDKSFFVEGTGNYVVQWESPESHVLIASADFRVDATAPFRLADLEANEARSPVLNVVVQQQVVRQLDAEVPRYVKPSWLVLEVRLLRYDAQVYSIDYCSEHRIGIVPDGDRDGPLLHVLPIGCMKFDAPNDGRKVLDFRDPDPLSVRSYDKMLERAGKVRQGRRPAIAWQGSAACGVCDEYGHVLPTPPLSRLDGIMGVLPKIDECSGATAGAEPTGASPASTARGGHAKPNVQKPARGSGKRGQ